jgi:hypothetical protein
MSKRPFQPAREDVRPEELEAYDRVIARQTGYGYGRPVGQEAGPYFGALLQAPLIADHLSELGVYYRTRGEGPGSFTHADREWTDMVIGKEISPAILYGHMLDAVASGVRPEAIKALYEDHDEKLTAEELQLAQYIRHFIAGNVSSEEYDRLEERLGERGAVEYTAWVAHLWLTARLISAFAPAAEDERKAQIEERLRSVIDGTADLPPGPRVPAAA